MLKKMEDMFMQPGWDSPFWKLACSVALGLSLFLLNWSWFPVGIPTVQASPMLPLSLTTLQASSSPTVYLPIIIRSSSFETQLLNLINAERASRGLSTLSADNLLAQVAEAHSQDMINRDFFDHVNPDGLDPGERLYNAGYAASTWGETIGAGQSTPAAMLSGWLNSPPHRAILLSPDYTEIGLGYVAGGDAGHYWTGVFATPQ